MSNQTASVIGAAGKKNTPTKQTAENGASCRRAMAASYAAMAQWSPGASLVGGRQVEDAKERPRPVSRICTSHESPLRGSIAHDDGQDKDEREPESYAQLEKMGHNR
jgi:hypothetical protein